MDDEQPYQDEAMRQHQQSEPEGPLVFPNLKSGIAWGESITQQRANELEVTIQEWEMKEETHKRRGPFDGTKLTGADVFWLAARTLARKMDPEVIAARAKRLLLESDIETRRGLPPELAGLHLEGAQLGHAHLNFACLRKVHMEGAYCHGASLQSAHLAYAYLDGAVFSDAHLEDALLTAADAEKAYFVRAHLEGARIGRAHLEGAHLQDAHLEDSYLRSSHLEGADLARAFLHGARLEETHLEGANLSKAHFEGKVMSTEDLALVRQAVPRFRANLPPATLQRAFFDSGSVLSDSTIGDPEHGYISVSDVRWGDINLAVIDWTCTRSTFLRSRIEVIELGDERAARSPVADDGKSKDRATWLRQYKEAVRANRQIATALRNQGLNEDADRFAYKAQRLQRQVLRRQKRWGAAFGSWLLDIIAGYGYRPMRAFAAYIIVIGLFTGLYLLNSHFVAPHLTWNEALVLSMSSFHGRGFFNPNIQLGDTYAQLAAVEALIGLLIEITFISSFTQRFFAR